MPLPSYLGENLKVFPKIRNKTRISLSPVLFSVVLEVLTNVIKQEKEMKGIQIGKKEIKVILFIDDIYIENTNKSTPKKILENVIVNFENTRLIFKRQLLSYIYEQ